MPRRHKTQRTQSTFTARPTMLMMLMMMCLLLLLLLLLLWDVSFRYVVPIVTILCGVWGLVWCGCEDDTGPSSCLLHNHRQQTSRGNMIVRFFFLFSSLPAEVRRSRVAVVSIGSSIAPMGFPTAKTRVCGLSFDVWSEMLPRDLIGRHMPSLPTRRSIPRILGCYFHWHPAFHLAHACVQETSSTVIAWHGTTTVWYGI